MTTRLLASFIVLDRYSKDIGNKHARKNRLLSQLPVLCCTSCQKPELSLSIDWDLEFAFPSAIGTNISKYKTRSEIISEKQEFQNNKLRCFMLRPAKSFKASSREDPTCRPEYRARHSRENVLPLSSPEDLAWRIEPLKGQERDSDGFTTVTLKKNPTCFKTITHSPRRQKWSREVEGILPQGLGRENSRAMVGGTLCYTDTSNWCTSPSLRDAPLTAFTEEEGGQFSLPKPVGRVVCQQLQQGNVVHVCTSHPRRNEESSVNDRERGEVSDGDEATAESVPLCLSDELERKTVKTLTPRAASVYAPLPIVSETYPVLCNSEYKHKPFSSSGFHSQSHPQRSASSRTVHSAIVRITESFQAKAIDKKRREREKEERLYIGALLEEVSQTQSVSLRVLSADGNVAKDTDPGRFPLRGKKLASFPATPPPTGRSPHEPLEAPVIPLLGPLTMIPPMHGRSSFKAVGPVLNGMNPNQAETSVSPQESFRPLLSETRRISSTLKNTHRKPANNQSNKKDFLLISKPLQNNKRNMNLFVSTKRQPNRDWHAYEQHMCDDNCVIPEDAERMNISVYGDSFLMTRSDSNDLCSKYPPSAAMRGMPLPHCPICHTEPPPSLKHTDQESQSYLVASGPGKDYSCKATNTAFDLDRAINIPTAENMP